MSTQQSQNEIAAIFTQFERQVPSNLAQDEHNAKQITQWVIDNNGGHFSIEALNAAVKLLQQQLHWIGLSPVDRIVEKIVEVEKPKSAQQIAESKRQLMDMAGLGRRKTEFDRIDEAQEAAKPLILERQRAEAQTAQDNEIISEIKRIAE